MAGTLGQRLPLLAKAHSMAQRYNIQSVDLSDAGNKPGEEIYFYLHWRATAGAGHEEEGDVRLSREGGKYRVSNTDEGRHELSFCRAVLKKFIDGMADLELVRERSEDVAAREDQARTTRRRGRTILLISRGGRKRLGGKGGTHEGVTRPEILADNVACLDYSVAKGQMLCAYRWEGEQKLNNDHFVGRPES